MNSMTAHPSHPQQERPARARSTSTNVPARRVSLVDRVALHLGIALVQWSRRSSVAVHHERRATRVRQELDREQRERLRQRQLLMLLPPR
jgi:hypothetical protein